jgi:hypothetical protein
LARRLFRNDFIHQQGRTVGHTPYPTADIETAAFSRELFNHITYTIRQSTLQIQIQLPSTLPDSVGTRPGVQVRLTIFVALLSMVGPFSIDAYLPSFQDIEAAFGISRTMLSQSLAVYLAAFAASTPLWGPVGGEFIIIA